MAPMKDSKTVTYRLELNAVAAFAIAIAVLATVLVLLPESKLEWTLKWFSADVLVWISDRLLPQFNSTLANLIITLAQPVSLVAYITASGLYGCWANWPEAKSSFSNCWQPVERAAMAVFILLSNPQTLIQYAFFALMVKAFTVVLDQVISGVMKTSKVTN